MEFLNELMFLMDGGHPRKKHWFIYTLKLQQNKFYIGYSQTPSQEVSSHFKQCGAGFTKKYKPTHIVKITRCKLDEDADEAVILHALKYISTYGISNIGCDTYANLAARVKKNTDQTIWQACNSCWQLFRGIRGLASHRQHCRRYTGILLLDSTNH
jgi:hypothetical protein